VRRSPLAGLLRILEESSVDSLVQYIGYVTCRYRRGGEFAGRRSRTSMEWKESGR
jgi:hypothetical protein